MAKDLLVGSTGFVGGNLAAKHAFAAVCHSTDIAAQFGAKPDLCVYAGVPAAMFLANADPDADLAVMAAARENLPAPDAVFIGGTKGNMAAVVEAALARNPAARICISAIALETLSAAVAALTAHGLQAEVCQISVSRAKAAGKLHLLMANNPIFLITRADEAEKSV